MTSWMEPTKNLLIYAPGLIYVIPMYAVPPELKISNIDPCETLFPFIYPRTPFDTPVCTRDVKRVFEFTDIVPPLTM